MKFASLKASSRYQLLLCCRFPAHLSTTLIEKGLNASPQWEFPCAEVLHSSSELSSSIQSPYSAL